MSTTTPLPIIVFIARSSGGGIAVEDRTRLTKSLVRSTRPSYAHWYGEFAEESQNVVFIQSSNAKLLTEVSEQLKRFMRQARESSRPIFFVVNGWDGLSTNAWSIVNLFQDFDDVNVKLRIYLIDTDIFREVDVRIAVLLLPAT